MKNVKCKIKNVNVRPTGYCATAGLKDSMNNKFIQLSHGGGGKEMEALIADFFKILPRPVQWSGRDQDAASLNCGKRNLVFSTDSYIVEPLFFKGGDIGKLAICGTINDLAVRGAEPIGISLGLIIEEGFPQEKLNQVLRSIASVARREKTPVVTGDTKVVERGGVKGIVINTSGVGWAEKVIDNGGLCVGDQILVSGGIGEHAIALLAQRFNYGTLLKSDCQSILAEIRTVRKYLTACKDPTRGGVAAILHEMARKAKVKIVLNEEQVPIRKEVKAVTEILGLSVYELACEGRFICGVRPRFARQVLARLKKYNKKAALIGRVEKGKDVILQTRFGQRALPMPEGKLVPRIC
jgi:hydrogenase expression/formation protein HypE